jgi:hypothetical protein
MTPPPMKSTLRHLGTALLQMRPRGMSGSVLRVVPRTPGQKDCVRLVPLRTVHLRPPDALCGDIVDLSLMHSAPFSQRDLDQCGVWIRCAVMDHFHSSTSSASLRPRPRSRRALQNRGFG